MLKKMVEEVLRELVSSEWFFDILRSAIKEEIGSPGFKRHVTARVRGEVDKTSRAVIVQVDDGDIIVLPGDVSDDEFAEFAKMIPPGKRLGVVSASDIKIVKFS